MKWYWIKTPVWVKHLFPSLTWSFSSTEKKVYLTFDDGPTPEITNWVLDQLDQFDAKATFFCVGDNISRYPELCHEILQKGHLIANHTQNHLNGWKTSTNAYKDNVEKCQNLISNLSHNQQLLFRPPYGKIAPGQVNQLKKIGYKIIMWDVLSADFDSSTSPEQCLNYVIQNVRSGSIVVFHDSRKSFRNLQVALPAILEFLRKKNYNCEVIS